MKTINSQASGLLQYICSAERKKKAGTKIKIVSKQGNDLSGLSIKSYF